MNTPINELKSNVFITSTVFLLVGLSLAVWLVTPQVVEGQRPMCLETKDPEVSDTRCSGRYAGDTFRDKIGQCIKCVAIRNAGAAYNTWECGYELQPQSACGTQASSDQFETPVVEPEVSLWQKITSPIVAVWNFGVSFWNRVFGFPIVLSLQLMTEMQNMNDTANEALQDIVIKLDIAKNAKDNLDKVKADPKSTPQQIAEAENTFAKANDEAKLAVDQAIKKVNDAKTGLNDANQTVQETYAQMGSTGPARNSQEKTDEVNKSADTVQAKLAKLMEALRVEDVFTIKGKDTAPTGRIDRVVRDVEDSIDDFKKTANEILDKNKEDTAKVEKKASDLTRKLSKNLVKLAAKAEETKKELTQEKVKELQNLLQSTGGQREKLEELTKKTGYRDPSNQLEIVVKAAAVLDVVKDTVDKLAKLDTGGLNTIKAEGSIDNFLVESSDVSKRAADEANAYAQITQEAQKAQQEGVGTLFVFLERVGEKPEETSQETSRKLAELGERLSERIVIVQAAREAARAVTTEEVPTIVEVTLVPAAEAPEAPPRLVSTMSGVFTGVFTDDANLQKQIAALPVLNTTNQSQQIVAKLTVKVDGKTYSAEATGQTVPIGERLLQLEIPESLRSTLAQGGTFTIIVTVNGVTNPKVGFLPLAPPPLDCEYSQSVVRSEIAVEGFSGECPANCVPPRPDGALLLQAACDSIAKKTAGRQGQSVCDYPCTPTNWPKATGTGPITCEPIVDDISGQRFCEYRQPFTCTGILTCSPP